MADPESDPVITLPPEYLKAIGALTTNAATMDMLLDHMIAVFLRTSPVIGRLITDPILSTKRKLALLNAIQIETALDDTIKKRFEVVYQKLTSAQANRSKIAHAKWGVSVTEGTDAEPKEYYIVSYEPGEEEPVTAPMPLSTLKGYATQMAQAHKALEDYLGSIEFRPGKRGKHRWPPVYNEKPPKR